MWRCHRIFVLIVLLLAGCVNAPETGRKQLSLVPESQVEGESLQAFQQMQHDTPVSADAAQNAEVQRVGKRIVAAALRSGAALPPEEMWQFVVFKDDKTVNAFAMPGGRIGVYSGMFKVATSENDLAVVLGHEVAHVAARHGAERESQSLLAGLLGAGLGAGLEGSEMTPEKKKNIMMAFGAGATLGFILPYSRTQEAEADQIGLLYTARAGYDPQAAVAFWQRMMADAQASGGEPMVFLSDHPSDASRIEAIQKEMPRAAAEYQQNQPH